MRQGNKGIIVVCAILFWVQAAAICQTKTNAGIPGDEDPATKAASLINKLASTAQPAEMASAKNQLVAMGKTALPSLHFSLTNDKRIFVRVQCCFILARIKDPSSLAVLECAARSPYPALDRAAIVSIKNIGGTGAVRTFERLDTVTADTNMKKLIRTSLEELKTKASSTNRRE